MVVKYFCARVLQISDVLDVYHSHAVMFNLERGELQLSVVVTE